MRFAQDLLERDSSVPPWDEEHHFRGTEEETAAYLLAVDTVNFCFWPPHREKKWEIVDHGKTYSGYYGLSVSLKKALESGIPFTDAGFLVSLTRQQLDEVFAGTGVLQLAAERLRNLRELGRVLLQKYHGRVSELVVSAQGSAVELVRRLASDLTSFLDQASYQGEKVFFYKRAQLFAADLHGALEGQGLGNFKDMEKLTAFADYKLPQVLRHVGVLEYSPGLAEKVDRMECIDPGTEEEVEIRSNTIWAAELMCREMKGLGKKMSAPQIDWLLWNLGQEDKFRAQPYHRAATIFY